MGTETCRFGGGSKRYTGNAPFGRVSGAQGGSGDSRRQNEDTENAPKWTRSSCLAIETTKTRLFGRVFDVSMGGE